MCLTDVLGSFSKNSDAVEMPGIYYPRAYVSFSDHIFSLSHRVSKRKATRQIPGDRYLGTRRG